MKIVIAGARAIGTYLAKLLSRNNEEIILIDDDEDSLDNISTNFDVLTLHAHPGSISALRQAGVQECDLYIAVTLDQHVNLESCAIAKALGAKQTVAKVEDYEFADPENHDTLQASGVDSVIYPELLGAKDIINGLKMSWVRLRWDVHNGALVMLGIKLRETAEILNKPLKDICGFMTKRNYIPLIRKLVGKEGYADVKNVMVMGGGKTAVRTASTLPDYMNMKIIEKDPARCELLNELLLDTDRVLVINGDGRDVSLLIEEGIKNTQAFVAITGNAETNILACLTAKRMGVRKTVAMVENLDYAAMAESLDHQQEGYCCQSHLRDADGCRRVKRALPNECQRRCSRVRCTTWLKGDKKEGIRTRNTLRNDNRWNCARRRGYPRTWRYADTGRRQCRGLLPQCRYEENREILPLVKQIRLFTF